ncbi:hypothetical protein GQ54DRAFT_303274 [Martensiomyces pterosporus]|nr:hypothetical protein GQ54DRAFT_303274 [Martensiomyces pterosporus]
MVAATIGVLLLVLGVTGLFDMFHVFGGNIIPTFAIVVGALVTVVSLVGIVGSLKQNMCLIGAHTGVLTVLVLVQAIFLVVVWLEPKDAEESFYDVWQGLYKNSPDTIRRVEKDLTCCGFRNPIDMAVPANCSINRKYGYSEGCFGALEAQWVDRRGGVLVAGITVVAVQVISLVLGAELARRFKRDQDEYRRLSENNESAALLRNEA